MYSKVEAAYEILKKHKKPMLPKEIIEVAIEKGMIKTAGLTPEATLRVDIYLENKRRVAAQKKLRFTKLDRGLIGLTEWEDKEAKKV